MSEKESLLQTDVGTRKQSRNIVNNCINNIAIFNNCQSALTVVYLNK